MGRICKACGAENRIEAKFCSQCGRPLPKIKKQKTKTEIEYEKRVKRFWLTVFVSIAIISIFFYIILKIIDFNKKVKIFKDYESKYREFDRIAFKDAKGSKEFLLEGLKWGMTISDIKKIYPYIEKSNDPDFVSSYLVNQQDFKVKIPHANFMSLGIYGDTLYAIKFEFGERKVYERQLIKVPNRDVIMYGRFMGLFKVFRKLFGEPTAINDNLKNEPLLKKIKYVKKGKTKNGLPSNIYIYWIRGETQIEIVLFSYKEKIKLTVRFLYLPIWQKVKKG